MLHGMQLATSQRPHPPPVPPRPSRQVVAEALKRSPRPPCPTRQAPAPPNTKPWRSNEKPGRTIVYESNNQKPSFEVSKSTEETKTPEESKTTEESKATQVPEECPKGLKECPQDSNHVKECPNDSKHSPRKDALPIVTDAAKSPKSKKPETIQQEKISPEEHNSDQESVVVDYSSPIPQSRRPSVESLLENEIYELVEECRLKNLEKRDGHDLREIRLGDIQLDPSRSRLRIQKQNLLTRPQRQLVRAPKPLERTTCPRPPIPIRNNFIPIDDDDDDDNDNRPRLPLKPRQRLSSQTSDNSGTNNSILSDDGATVVIVDEPERKFVVFNDDGDNIHHQDWLEAGVRYSSTQITLSGDDEASDRVNGFAHLEDEVEFGDLDFSSILERIAMSSLQGLPPLPRSLSGFNLNSGRGETVEPPPPPTRSSSKTQRSAKTPTNVTQSSSRPSPPARQLTTLDTQLAILRREMFGLRQLDLSLLSQLWSLNESIQEFRQLLQEQEDRAPSPSPSSEDGDDNIYGPHSRRPVPALHHHRPPRPPRPPKPPPSDESPSSEEYGAV